MANCEHGTPLRLSFRGMKLVGLEEDSLLYRCARCRATATVPRCAVQTVKTGLRCKHPTRPMYQTCAKHAKVAR